jgi:hypothetical protein
LGFYPKNCAISRQLFTSTFLQAAVAGPILGIDFLRKFEVIVSPEISQIQFTCSAAALPANILPSAALSASFFFCLARHRPGSNSAAHCDDFFPASCLRISSPESRDEVVQL